MTAQKVSIDELWALAQQHAKSLERDRDSYLPTIDEDKKMHVNGMEVFFHIDNDPAITYRVRNTEDLVYFDCPELYDWDNFDGINSSEIMSSKDELLNRIEGIVEDVKTRS